MKTKSPVSISAAWRSLNACKICVTGGIACGKSAVGGILEKHGVRVIEADHICHELLLSDKEVYRQLLDAFGARILDDTRRVDRRALGEIVFNDRAELEKLNKIVHPVARSRMKGLFSDRQVKNGDPVQVAVVPLVYEAGWEDEWDMIVCVAAPRSMQISRMIQRGLSTDQAEARISAQMPVARKMEKADFVVFNSGSMELLEEQIMRVFRLI